MERGLPCRKTYLLLALCVVSAGLITIYNMYLKEQVEWKQVIVSNYLVDTPQCRIPDLDLMDPSIAGMFSLADHVVCSKEPLLTYTKDLELLINLDAVKYYGTSDPEDINCCYQAIHRVNQEEDHYDKYADSEFRYDDNCKAFKNTVRLGEEEEFVRVKCSLRRRPVYTNFHAVVPAKKNVVEKLHHKDPISRPLSVLLWGLDSVSRLNLHRSLPRTTHALKSHGAVEFYGYMKVGLNTYPNMIPILTGYSGDELAPLCKPTSETKMDDCPLIWKNFSDKGHVTVYIEDAPDVAAFNYLKQGFVKQPTDYYFRPYVLASEAEWAKVTSLPFCMGPAETTAVLQGYGRDFANRFRDHPYFGLMWHVSLGHNEIYNAAQGDVHYEPFITGLIESGVLNNTVLIFLSDHGLRFGTFRETYIGYLEDHLPYLFVWLPQWVREQYPNAYKNLHLNAHKLTSHYDLHETLVDILNMDLSGEARPNHVTNVTRQPVSLFSQVPADRSCEQAGVPPAYCMCQVSRPVPRRSEEVRKATMAILKRLNVIVEGSPECASLELEQVEDSRAFMSTSSRSLEPREVSDYLISVKTVPGHAKFQATVRCWNDTGTYEVVGDISRINLYKGQSDCVNDVYLRLYCYCRENQKTVTKPKQR